jgi:tetratricopeptide (TPR) repeat protein
VDTGSMDTYFNLRTNAQVLQSSRPTGTFAVPTLANRDLSRLVADAQAHHQAGRLGEAEAAYQCALAISPGHAAIAHNLGVIAASRGAADCAISYFDQAIAAEPRYASAHFNRAVAQQVLGRSRQAIDGFSRASALEPGHYEAHRALALLWLAQGERGRALDHFARTYELRRGEDRTQIAIRSLNWATRDKLLHDCEQFRFLAARHRDGHRFHALASAYAAVAEDFPHSPAELSAAQMDALGDDYNTAIHVLAAPELVGPAVRQRTDTATMLQAFQQTGVVYFDNLLTPHALLQLKRYLLEGTIWHDFSHIDGFVASYLEDGLACPLLLQIADEIRHILPELLEKRPLSQAWVFKGLRPGAAIDAHADDAAISLNFWLTPGEANLDPGRGGLSVCHVPPPAAWQFKDYHADRRRIADFMDSHARDTQVVGYRENRAVLFRSCLFHRSDAPHFASGYENHRINLTMLFGGHES